MSDFIVRPRAKASRPAEPRPAVRGRMAEVRPTLLLWVSAVEWLNAFGSLGLRSLVGPMGALPGVMGYCSASGGVEGCAGSGALFGLVGGLLAVDLFDALVLAHSDADVTGTSRFTPSVSAGPGYVAISGALP